MEDKFILGGKEFHSRFILGSGKYNLNLIKAAVEQGGAEIITLALRRANTQESENILDFIPKGVTLLPNTSGARTAEEAVRIARLSRAMGCGDFVKVEIMRDAKYLFPDNYETVKATEILAKEGISASVIDMYCVKPLDKKAVVEAAQNTKLVVTVEEHAPFGGLGSMVSQVVAAECSKKVINIALPDAPVITGNSQEVFAYYGMDGEGIAKSARQALFAE